MKEPRQRDELHPAAGGSGVCCGHGAGAPLSPHRAAGADPRRVVHIVTMKYMKRTAQAMRLENVIAKLKQASSTRC